MLTRCCLVWVAMMMAFWLGTPAFAQSGISGALQMNLCDQETYTITVTNDGADPACHLVVTSSLPNSNFTYVSNTSNISLGCANNEPVINGNNVTWDINTLCGSTTLAPGASFTIEYAISTNCETVSGSNPVNISYTDCPNGAVLTDTDSLSIEILPGDVVVRKTPAIVSAGIGETATWTITVENTGLGTIENVEVTDLLQAGLAYDSSVPAGNNAGATTTWTSAQVPALAAIAPGDTVDITVNATVVSCENLDNMADVRWGCGGGNTCYDTAIDGGTATASVELVRHSPDLTVSPGPVAFNYCEGTLSDRQLEIENIGDGASFPDDGAGNNSQVCVNFGGLVVSNVRPGGVTYTNGCFNLPRIEGGGNLEILYDLTHTDLCAGSGSGSLAWEPRYYDECGNEYLSQVILTSYTEPSDIPELIVNKTGVSEIEIGNIISYHIDVDYQGATNCNGNPAAPVTVTDTYPAGFTVSNADGGVVDANGNTITWTYDPGVNPNFNADVSLQLPDDCAAYCNRVLTNTVEASVADCCVAGNCVRNATATADTAIECSGGIATTDKSVAPAPIQSCEAFDYANTYTFTNNAALAGITLDELTFSEDAANNQQYIAGSLAATLDGADLSGCVAITDNTPGGTLDLDFSGCPVTPVQSASLMIGYRLELTENSTPNPGCGDPHTWYDWSTLDLGSAAGQCLTDGQLHETVQPVVEPPVMTLDISGFPTLMTTCDTFDVDITINRTSATGRPYDVELRLDTTNYTFVRFNSYDGIHPVSGPTDNGAYVSFNYADLFAGGDTQAVIHATIRKVCGGDAGFSATLYYDDNCGNDATSDQECSASFNYAPPLYLDGRVIIEKNPEIVFAENNQVQWTIYVTSTGQGPARNVWVDDVLGAGLTFASAVVSPDNGDVTILPNSDHTGAAINGASIIIDEMAAAQRRTITLTADVVDCQGLTNDVTTSFGCNENNPSDGWDNACPPSVGDSASVVVPEGKLVLTSSFPTPMNACSQNTGTITVRNTGVTTLYHLDIAQTLPAGLTYVPGSTQVDGAAGGDPVPAVSPMHWTEGQLPVLASIDPGQVITIQYDVLVDCDFTGGDTTTLVDYQDLCGDPHATDPSRFAIELDMPDISVEKVRITPPGNDVIGCGDAVSWEIRVTNNSSFAAQVIWVEDTVGDFFTVTGHAGGADGGYMVDPQHVQWEIVSLAPGTTEVLTLNATTDNGVNCGTELTNTATVFWGCGIVDGLSSTNPATEGGVCLANGTVEDTHLSRRQPDANMTMSIVPGSIDSCAESTRFSVTIQNTGTTDASSIDLRAVLPAGLVYNSGTVAVTCPPGGGGSGDPAGGAGPNLIFYDINDTATNLCDSLPAGQSITLAFDLQSTCYEPAPINFTLYYYDCCGDTQYTTEQPFTIPGTTPDLAITKTAASNQVDCGDDQTWTIRVTNNGAGNAQVVRIEDTPGAWIDVNLAASPGLVDMTHGVYGWEINNLAPGASRSFTLVGTLNPDGAPQSDCTESLRHNRTRAMWGCGTAGDAGDNDPRTQNYDCSDATWVTASAYNLRMPDLQVGAINVDFSCNAGNVFDGTITVAIRNQGDAPTLHPATVTLMYDGAPVGTGTLPAGLAAGALRNVTIDASGWGVDCTVCTAGTFTAVVDSGDAECECNEANNSGTLPYQCASYGNLAWDDSNGNGVQDGGEPGIEDVTVELFGSAGNSISATQTNGSGNYQFTHLWPGDYYAVFDASTANGAYLPTGRDLGADNADSDADTVTGRTATTTLTPGENDPDWDAGYFLPASLGNYVWIDSNGNGIQDAGETPVANVPVRLTGTDGQGNTVNLTTTTAADGSYLFNNLAPGNYRVTFTPPAGYAITQQDQGGDDALDSDAIPANGQTAITALESGENDLTWDAGLYIPATLGDTVWDDTNGDGIQDAGEPGIGNVTVNLLNADGTPALDSGGNAITTTTNGSGAYAFTDLPPGDYRVEFVPPAGYTLTGQDRGGDDAADSDADPATGRTTAITLVSGENDPDWDAGMYRPASLGNFVWDDTNGDGVQDAGEPGVANVTVTLTGTDNLGTPVNETRTTAGDGSYLFDNLVPGDYQVTFTLPGGYEFTRQDQGGDDGLDSDANPANGQAVTTTLVSGENDLTWDAGIYRPATLGNFVWLDANGNGLQDGGEPGINNVTVNLLNADGSPALDSGGNAITTTTDGTGFYEFTDLRPDDYLVEFVPPAGFKITPQDAGNDDTIDSDANPAAGRTASITLLSGDNNPDADAGLYNPASVGDTVWYDWNADGVQDTGESGIAGITVNLYDDAGNLVATTVTDGNGNYLFDDLRPGTYRIDVDTSSLPSGLDPTYDLDGGLDSTATFFLGNDEDKKDVNFGFRSLGAIGDTLWNDTTPDGAQGAGEPGIAGVRVILEGDLDGDGIPEFTREAVTDASGSYLFDALPPGDYTIRIDKGTIPGGYVQTGDPDKSFDGMSRISLAQGERNLVQDFGYVLPRPGVSVEKSTNGEDADTPPGPEIKSGDPVTWIYAVTNTGNTWLNNIQVTDSRNVVVTCTERQLAPGASTTCTGTGTAQVGPYENVATVTGASTDASGNPIGGSVSASDSSHYTGVTPSVTQPKPPLPPIIIDAPSGMSPIPFNAGTRGKQCCLAIQVDHVTASETSDIIPVNGPEWFDTYNSMFAAAEFAGTRDELSGWLRAEGIEPDRNGLVSRRYQRILHKAGLFAAFNVDHMTMQSGLGLGIAIAPDVRKAAARQGVSAEIAARTILEKMAAAAGLKKLPAINPRMLEYAGGVPVYRSDPARGDLSWDRSQMDRKLVPLVWGTSLAAQAQLLPNDLGAGNPMDRFAGQVMAWIMTEKVKLIASELVQKSADGRPYVAHAYRIKPTDNGVDVTVKSDEIRLSDQAALLWGLSRMRAVFARTGITPPDELDPLIGIVWQTIDRLYDAEAGVYAAQGIVAPYDAMLMTMALASLAGENTDLPMADGAGTRLMKAVTFLSGKMIAADGGVVPGYNLKKGQPVTGTRTLADQAAVLRALVVHRDGMSAADRIYDFMEKNLWDTEHGLYRDRADWPMTGRYTPESVGAVVGGLGRLALHTQGARRLALLDHLNTFFETVVARSELQQRGYRGMLAEGGRRVISGHGKITDLRRPIPVPSRRYRDDIIETGHGRRLAPVLVSEIEINFIPLEAAKLQALKDSIDLKVERFGPRTPLFNEPIRLPKLGPRQAFETAGGMMAAGALMSAAPLLADQSRVTDDAFFADPAMLGDVSAMLSETARDSLIRLTMQSGNGLPLTESTPVAEMAAASGVSPQATLTAWLQKTAEQHHLSQVPKALMPVYVEFADGRPAFPYGLTAGWDVRGSDEKISLAGLAETLAAQLTFMETAALRQSPADPALDGFLAQVTGLSVAAKVTFIEKAFKSAVTAGLDELPAHFSLVRDSAGKVLDLTFPEPAGSPFARIALLGAMGDFMALDEAARGWIPGYAVLQGRVGQMLSHAREGFNSRYVDAAGHVRHLSLADAGLAADTFGKMVQRMPEGYRRKPETVALVKNLATYLVDGKASKAGNDLVEGPAARDSLADKAAVILGLARAGEVLKQPALTQKALDQFAAFDRRYWSRRIGTYLPAEHHDTLKQVRITRYQYSAEDIGLTIGMLARLMPLADTDTKARIAGRLAAFTPHLVAGNRTSGADLTREVDHIRAVALFLADRDVLYPGDILTFKISVENRQGHNPGCGDLDKFKVRNVLPPGVSYIANSARLEDRPVATHVNGRSQTWTVDHLAMGDAVTITFRARVDDSMRDGIHRTRAESGGYCFHPANGGDTALCGITDDDSVALGAVNRIRGRIFIDSDGDGRREPGDRGAAGIRVILDDNRATDTDETGTFWFDKLLPGVYQVRIDSATLPGDLHLTTDAIRTVVLDAGKTFRVDLGLTRYRRLEGTVFNDANGNGTRDNGETGAAGVRVRVKGTGYVAYTAVDGRFRVDGVPAGITPTVVIDVRQPYAEAGHGALGIQMN